MNSKHEWSLLIIRVVLGITFFVHGLAKFQGGIDNIAGWFASIGLPGFLAYAVALIEMAGGIALILGLGTRIVSALFAIIMIGAIVKVKIEAGFLGNGKMAGSELDIALMAMAAALLVSGSRLYSLGHFFFQKEDEF